MSAHGYVFILTPIDISDPSGTELAPAHRIAKANNEQVDQIKRLLDQFNTKLKPFFISPYEYNVRAVEGDKPGNVRYFHDPLPCERWRYWIVAFEGTNSELGDLQLACTLIQQDIELGFEVLYNEAIQGPFYVWHPPSLQSFLDSGFELLPPKQIEQTDLAQIRRNFDDIKNLPQEYVHIRRALTRFDQLKSLPRTSELVVIGLFSVIESLVSHAPTLTEAADSLTHQLRTKLPLLRKRFQIGLEHGDFFPDVDEETLWKRLYEYRSKIVHGENSTLSGKLQVLRDRKPVIAFLRETAKRLFRLSLSEPQFISDLKKC